MNLDRQKARGVLRLRQHELIDDETALDALEECTTPGPPSVRGAVESREDAS